MTMIIKCNHHNMFFLCIVTLQSVTMICFSHNFQTMMHLQHRSLQRSGVNTLSNFPFDFDTIFNFLYRSHDMILIKLSDGNRTLTNFRKLFRFDFWHSTYVFIWYYFCRNHNEKKNWIKNLTENCTVWTNLNMYIQILTNMSSTKNSLKTTEKNIIPRFFFTISNLLYNN
jgi:hypothetical protein